MTPAINLLVNKRIPHVIHEYSHDPSNESYADEAAIALGVENSIIFKTLVVQLDNKELAVGVIPISNSLSVKAIARTLGSKKAMMANKNDVTRSTGYILGGVSPLAQKKPLKTVIDISADEHTYIYISGGKRGLEIELSPTDLASLCSATFADIKQ